MRRAAIALFLPALGCSEPASQPKGAADPADGLPLVSPTSERDDAAWRAAHPRGTSGTEALRVVIASSSSLEGHHLVLTGTLINETQDAVSFQSTGGAFRLSLSPSANLPLRPLGAPQATPAPMPMVSTIPARSRILYTSSIDLDRYAYPPGGHADLDWSFAGLSPERRGTLKAQALPADAPKGVVRPVPPG